MRVRGSRRNAVSQCSAASSSFPRPIRAFAEQPDVESRARRRLGAGSSALHAQELQFNVSYQCSGGLTVVITRCETGPRGEFCFFEDTVNGVGRGESYGRRKQIQEHVSACQPP